jgi:hypothetical protein
VLPASWPPPRHRGPPPDPRGSLPPPPALRRQASGSGPPRRRPTSRAQAVPEAASPRTRRSAGTWGRDRRPTQRPCATAAPPAPRRDPRPRGFPSATSRCRSGVSSLGLLGNRAGRPRAPGGRAATAFFTPLSKASSRCVRSRCVAMSVSRRAASGRSRGAPSPALPAAKGASAPPACARRCGW